MAMHDPPHPGEFITGASGISPEMALRLSKTLGRSPESWLAKQRVNLGNVGRVRLTAA